jgi:integrase
LIGGWLVAIWLTIKLEAKMATIRKRNDKFVVIYDYRDAQGNRKQKWESFAEKTEAQKYKKQMELNKLNKSLVSPSVQTVEAFLHEWAELHAKAKWQYNTYTGAMGMIRNHIIPLIGGFRLQDIAPRDIDVMFDSLRTKKIFTHNAKNKPEEEIPALSSTTLRHIYMIVKKAFDKAVDWKLIQSSPVVCDAPRKNKVKKAIWDADMFREALSDMTSQPLLHLAVHLAFICSTRIGEVTGLTVDSIDFATNRIHIDKTLQRVSKEALAFLPRDNLIFTFPCKEDGKKSVLILKKPKTDSSDRYVYMTEQLRTELLERIEQIAREKAFLGKQYSDFGLVIALEDGSPVEPKLCEKWFKKWQERTEHDFPDLIFHGIRHSSTTYKLGISSGDIKSVQGDTGHASAGIVVDTYSHIQDRRRAQLINSIEEDFYKGGGDETPSDNDKTFMLTLMQAIKKDPLMQQKVLDALLAHQA